MLAANRNYEEVVVKLVRAGANVNEKNKVRQQLTYFHHYDVVITLLFIVIVWEDRSHVGCS